VSIVRVARSGHPAVAVERGVLVVPFRSRGAVKAVWLVSRPLVVTPRSVSLTQPEGLQRGERRRLEKHKTSLASAACFVLKPS
jgi:hypothetical protein